MDSDFGAFEADAKAEALRVPELALLLLPLLQLLADPQHGDLGHWLPAANFLGTLLHGCGCQLGNPKITAAWVNDGSCLGPFRGPLFLLPP